MSGQALAEATLRFLPVVPDGLQELLQARDLAGLPSDDVRQPGRHFFLIVGAAGPVGFGGLEGEAPDLLLRSVVVHPDGRGLGTKWDRLIQVGARRGAAPRRGVRAERGFWPMCRQASLQSGTAACPACTWAPSSRDRQPTDPWPAVVRSYPRDRRVGNCGESYDCDVGPGRPWTFRAGSARSGSRAASWCRSHHAEIRP